MYTDCCVFRPTFGCCAHPKAGRNLYPPPTHPHSSMHPCTTPMHRPMNDTACPSTQTPIRPKLKNTNWDYSLLLLFITYKEVELTELNAELYVLPFHKTIYNSGSQLFCSLHSDRLLAIKCTFIVAFCKLHNYPLHKANLVLNG